MLRSYIKEKNITVINMADEGNDRDAEVTIVNKRTRQSSKEHNGKQDVRKRRHGTDSTKIVSERDEKKRKLVAECKATIQTIANKYNLSERFVLQLLFQCSNDVNRSVSYIEYGPHSPDLPPWTEADDKALERNPKAAGLIRKFGLADVIGRYNFMNYIT
ncbi:uncharacterized protein LOC128557082 [Mercenaria mercenaria]|uniref:uncharacterized protein LOC128557082 n=1 Tax=Mercenaria mercenaria TaxID=6596 RepID=UPI00234E7460|nr:uncharacterized protein LOC128557082 [Mercenaria mercenaria]